MVSVNIAALVLRLAVGGTMVAHGWNHAFGGGKLPGTARWFESIGIRPGRVHAPSAESSPAAFASLLDGLTEQQKRQILRDNATQLLTT
jgi:putative oxidoreductase